VANLKIIKKSKTLIREIQKYKLKKKKIGFVPTLGALHKGHLELIRLAKKESDVAVVSIFLNPLQFNSKSDFKRYPTNLITDKKKINKEKVNILYIPTINDVFPSKKIKRVKVSSKTNKLCGKFRKGHFNGVVTVLKSLFEQVSPNLAFFGEKDFQQILIIKDLISEYKLKIKIITIPTVRDNTGLAYSSRNNLLNNKQKKIASFLFKTIKEISFEAKKNLNKLNNLKFIGKKKLINYGFSKVDYLEIYNENNLSKKNIKKNNLRVFVAACIGKTRLIDKYKN
jgi:pantoate--beta-alanine ligase